MKKVEKSSKLNQFANQLMAQNDLKKVKGGDDIIIVDVVIE